VISLDVLMEQGRAKADRLGLGFYVAGIRMVVIDGGRRAYDSVDGPWIEDEGTSVRQATEEEIELWERI
jgi:hypothetical protein